MPTALTPLRPVAAGPAAPPRPGSGPAAPRTDAPWLATRGTPPPTLEAAARRLAELAGSLAARGDRRAVFATVYEMQVRDMAREVLVPGRYADPAWMTRLALDFAQRYLDAFDAYERGDRAAVPEGWGVAFDHARTARGPLVNDLLLSMNVHIIHDLALSAAATGATPAHAGDYMRFNETMRANVDRVQTLVESRFLNPKGSLVGALDTTAGPLDEALAGDVISRLRRQAWHDALALGREGRPTYERICRRAAWNAHLIDRLGQLVPASWVRRGLI